MVLRAGRSLEHPDVVWMKGLFFGSLGHRNSNPKDRGRTDCREKDHGKSVNGLHM
jgi:hypothetical protein